ncbi:MAG TPA: hypothetical protein VJA19_11970 [Pseudomonas sp.]|nr:hypothetical protein [Pseudomonas sp.]
MARRGRCGQRLLRGGLGDSRLGNRLFTLYKFRSMRFDLQAGDQEIRLTDVIEHDGDDDA